ncbi:MAG: GlsB/YeaQ/YmgE family stress response membrane protein [Burkholderiaceae bacterium]|nr:GlsB/YeaQ/YmgE family stress response membrane protein [Burkholderiaceae bacterium]
MLNWIWTFIVGIVIGVIAKWIMPVGHVGWIMTGIIGIVGSFIGGFIARLFSKPADGALVHPAGILLSIVGAVILLFVWRYVGPAIGV